jgi:hypothetical protein
MQSLTKHSDFILGKHYASQDRIIKEIRGRAVTDLEL